MERIKRDDLKANVNSELAKRITDSLSDFDSSREFNENDVYNHLINVGYISITAPEEEPPMLHMITMDSLKNYRNGSSIKPGNIRLNIKRLVQSIPNIIVMGAGIESEFPIITICGALTLWTTIKQIYTIEITKEQAFIIVALWKQCDGNHKISLEKGFIETNILLKQYGENELTNVKYNNEIDVLTEMKCIELTENVIWLREWISKNYIENV